MPHHLTRLGHASFRLDTAAGTRIYVDPWLGGPTCPDGERTPDRADLVVITHGHSDHVGDAVSLNQRLGCPVVAQVEVRGWLTRQGAADDGMAHSANKGGTVTVAGIGITLTDANHSSSGPDGEYLGEPCGIVLTLEDGFRVYVSGDTNVFGDMALIRRIYAPDVAVLPIGDHFTMGPREAAVALELLGVKRCVPSHYGTFPLLTGTPEALRELAPAGVEIVAPAPGETIEL